MTLVVVSERGLSGREGRGWPDWWLRLRSTLLLAALVFSVLSTGPGVGPWGVPLLVLVAAGWLSWSFGPALLTRRPALPRSVAAEAAGPQPGGAQPADIGRALAGQPALAWAGGTASAADLLGALAVGLGGLGLSLLQSPGPAVGFVAVACLNAGARTPPRVAATLSAALGLAWLAAHLLIGRAGTPWIFAGPGLCLIGLMAGLIRRQNNVLVAETRLTREEQARSAALAERARIAREIHDVLAHSLAALTVQLETADALLEGGRAEQARGSVIRAGQLAREGLAETRRAISALRGETLPLPELLAGLAGGYRADLAAPAVVHVDGEPTPLSPDTGLAIYRTAQEAVTNVRKHAPGAPVELTLRYGPGSVELAVANGAPPPSDRPLSGSGGGYGLTGLRERAELAGGQFTAGPDGEGWRVDVRIPA